MAKQCFVENDAQISKIIMIMIIIFLYQKDQPLLLEEIKYMKLDLITAKTQQIQRLFLEQLKHQEVQKQWNQ